MAKQDVLDAINATIAPNNIKGITAESLNNVLTMMTENAGEGGSGDGALRIIVPEMMMFGPEFIHIGEFSPTSWEEMKSNFEQATGVDLSEYDAAVKASFEHNANIAQQILEKGKAGQGVSVVLDQTPYFPAVINVSFQMEPEMVAFYEDFAMCAVQPAGLFMQYIKPTPEGESMFGGNVFSCALAPAGNMDLEGLTNYPSNMLIILNLDGILTFEVTEEEQPSSGSGVVTFYINPLEELTSEQKAKNVSAYNVIKGGADVSVNVKLIVGDGMYSISFPYNVIVSEEDTIVLELINNGENGFISATALANPDGSIDMVDSI
jgi:hypothetical protein